MLVLRRSENEIICIGDDIEIMVTEVCTEHAVKLGISAPSSIPVHRKEVYQAIQRENLNTPAATA